MPSRKLISGAIAIAIVTITGGLVGSATAQQARQRPLPQTPMSSEMPPPPTDQDNLKTTATNLNNQRSEYYRKGDLAGLTSVYTPDATYIQLLPRLSVMKGRAQIQQHTRELMDSKASDLVLTVTTAEMTGNDTMMVGGDYYVAVQGGKKVNGHFFQVLRREGGTWKIAMHTFARPEPITPIEVREYHVGG